MVVLFTQRPDSTICNLHHFPGGETVSLGPGLSNRTYSPLLTSSTVSQTVLFFALNQRSRKSLRKMHKGSGKLQTLS